MVELRPEFIEPAQCGLCCFWPYLSPEKLTMRDCYSSHAAALRDALRHAVERGGMSSLGVLHQGVPPPSILIGTDATAQAARVRRQLDRLAPLPRALLVIAYAPRSLKCSCGSRCCAGSYPNPEWEDAMRETLAHVGPLLTGKAANERLHRAIIANVLTRTKETAVSLAERYGVHRLTVAAHVGIIETDLIGNRHTPGRFDHAGERIDALLREAGIVIEQAQAAA
jgi:hypothetical protein